MESETSQMRLLWDTRDVQLHELTAENSLLKTEKMKYIEENARLKADVEESKHQYLELLQQQLEEQEKLREQELVEKQQQAQVTVESKE